MKIQLNKYIDMIDEGLENILKNNGKYINSIIDSMKYSLFTGGKRIRPILAIKSYEIFAKNIDYKEILPFALAIEMIHTYSLIHDDLPAMDNDNIRRGKPTNHIIYGEAMAILAGDGLLNLAFETMLSGDKVTTTKEEYKKYFLAIQNIINYSGINGMIGGQVIDLHSDSSKISDEELLFMYESKTAGLIKAATVAGAIIGGANESQVEIIREFGKSLGMAYQIRDDILDIKEDEKIRKLTYLSHFGLEKGKEDLNYYSEYAKEQLYKLEFVNVDFFLELTDSLNDRKI